MVTGTGNNSATSNNIKLVHWPLIGGLLHLVQPRGDWAGPQPGQAPHRCTKCDRPLINCQCANCQSPYCCIGLMVFCSEFLMCPLKNKLSFGGKCTLSYYSPKWFDNLTKKFISSQSSAAMCRDFVRVMLFWEWVPWFLCFLLWFSGGCGQFTRGVTCRLWISQC